MKSGGEPTLVVPEPPLLVVIAGIDPGGGAGLLRDSITARALGARVHVVGTAWTEQGEGAFHAVEPRDPARLENAVRQAVAREPAAIKIGMVPTPEAAAAIVRALDGWGGPVVVDPVLATSRGGPLYAGDPRQLLPLLRRATLVTPNAPEAAVLAGRPVDSGPAAEAAARALRERAGIGAVLLKGGHLGHPGGDGDDVVDRLDSAAGARAFGHPRVSGPSPRGTGCALATAIAVELARGAALEPAVERAIAWLGRAIAEAVDQPDGERHLPG
jgi:hydroxymethylpyrimidine/phosphomethylpyrimidine kinase